MQTNHKFEVMNKKAAMSSGGGCAREDGWYFRLSLTRMLKKGGFGFDLAGQFVPIELGALGCGWPWLVCKTVLNWISLFVFMQSFRWTPQTSSELRIAQAQEARSQRHFDDTWKGSCKQDGGNTFTQQIYEQYKTGNYEATEEQTTVLPVSTAKQLK